jgi:outer membrane receptor protein involved in Fe transport
VTNGSSLYFSKSYTFFIANLIFYGYEGEFNWAATEKFTIFGNYSHQRNNYSKDPNLHVAELPLLSPMNKGKVSFRYSLPKGMRVLSDFQFIGKRGTEGGYALKQYSLGDVSLEKTFSNNLSCSAYMNNSWDQAYEQVWGFPSPGRTFGVRLKMNAQPFQSNH